MDLLEDGEEQSCHLKRVGFLQEGLLQGGEYECIPESPSQDLMEDAKDGRCNQDGLVITWIDGFSVSSKK